MVTIYTTETCPKCSILKKKMVSAGIDFKECNDAEVLMGMGLTTVPWLEADGEMMDFGEANNWINKQE